MNWGIKLLQSSALPLGYGAILNCMLVSRQIFSIFIAATIVVYHILLVLSIHFFKLYDIFCRIFSKYNQICSYYIFFGLTLLS